MATYYIRNEGQLKELVLRKISRGLLEYVSKKVVKIMRNNLEDSEISTRSLQTGVDYSINNIGNESTIYIEYELVQDFAASPPLYYGSYMVEWGQFTNSIGKHKGEQTWNGELISFQMAKWLEYGGGGNYGNQPIEASHWFTKTKQEVETNLQSWAREYLRQNGFIK